jgi:hypothetical protein
MAAERLTRRRMPRAQADAAFGEIHAAVLGASSTLDGPDFSSMALADMRLLYQLYDQRFFDGALHRRLGRDIGFHLNKRLRSSGGRTVFDKRQGFYVIELAPDLIIQSFGGVARDIEVCGRMCSDRLQAAMRIFEHELCHLAEFVERGTSSCSRRPFQAMAEGLFGHGDHRHRLVTAPELVRDRLGIQAGDRVRFARQGTWVVGRVGRITKRATVYVPDPTGEYVDTAGRRFEKFYVPVDALESLPS